MSAASTTNTTGSAVAQADGWGHVLVGRQISERHRLEKLRGNGSFPVLIFTTSTLGSCFNEWSTVIDAGHNDVAIFWHEMATFYASLA